MRMLSKDEVAQSIKSAEMAYNEASRVLDEQGLKFKKRHGADKPLLAYTVTDGDEGWAIVFAHSGIAARRIGAQELDTDFEYVESCRRTKWADQYAPGPVPKLAMLEHGWWWECMGCDGRVSYDEDDLITDRWNPETEQYEEIIREIKPVEHRGHIYCCEECYLRDKADNARRKKAERQAIDDLSQLVMLRHPEARITGTHVYCIDDSGWYEPDQIKVRFQFPGCQYWGAELEWEKGKLEQYVAGGDKGNWEAYLASKHLNGDE